jgi:hypothetical protein
MRILNVGRRPITHRNLIICLCLCIALTACSRQAKPLPPPDKGGGGGTVSVNLEDALVPGESDADILPLDTVLFTVGKMPITFGEFLFQYKIVVSAFFNSGQADYFEVDSSIPLDEQYYDESIGMTWQKMLDNSVQDALRNNIAMYQDALANGSPMGDWEKDYVQSFLDFIDESSREENITADEFVGKRYGEGLTLSMVTEYQQRYWAGVGYENRIREDQTFTDDDLDAYYELNKDQVDLPDCTLVTLRNIFMYDKDAARDMLDEFDKGDQAEETFIEIAKTYSDDEASKDNGGLQENYRPSGTAASLTEMEAWLFDSVRNPGDIKIYEWDNGIEMVYFVSKGEPFWKVWSRENLQEDIINQIVDKYPLVQSES